MESLNWVDVAIIAILLFSTLFAVLNGLVRSLLSLLLWGLSIYVSIFVINHAPEFLPENLSGTRAVMILAGIIAFVVSFIIGAIINRTILSALGDFTGGGFDKFLGFMFGILRGGLIIIVIFISVQFITATLNIAKHNSPELLKPLYEAKSYDYLEKTSNLVVEYAPDSIKKYADSVINKNEKLSKLSGRYNKFSEAILTGNNKKITDKMIKALPADELEAIYDKHDVDSKAITSYEKVKITADIFLRYKQLSSEGKIDSNKKLTFKEIETLEQAFINLKESPTKQEEKGNNNKSINENNKGGYSVESLDSLNELIKKIN